MHHYKHHHRRHCHHQSALDSYGLLVNGELQKSVDQIMKNQSITNLNENVNNRSGFRYLLSIADLNEKANEATETVFTKHYSTYKVVLRGQGTGKSKINEKTLEITINTASNCAIVLRNFGNLMKNLKLVGFNLDIDGRWTEVCSLINEKCTKSVTELELSNCDSDFLAGIKFGHVSLLKITCNRLDEEFWNGIDRFPNLRTLEWHHDRTEPLTENIRAMLKSKSVQFVDCVKSDKKPQ